MSASPTIVVLDGQTANPGDLSWAGLEALGPCQIHARTPPELVLSRAQSASILLTNKTVLNRQVLLALPNLRYVGVLATGFNVVDLPTARERGLVVTNVPNYGTRSVVQLTFALLLELTHQVGQHARGVREGRWSRCPDFCYWETPLIELDGLRMGLIGFGNIGRQVASVATAFGLRVLVHTPHPPTAASEGVEFVSLDELLARSDVVSLHCPLTSETRQLINPSRLALMKSSALLLNTGRGALVDEAALAEALNSGRLAGAAVDVLSVEPPSPDNPLLTARNCLITPHLAWATQAARGRLLEIAVANVRAFLDGHPQHVVS